MKLNRIALLCLVAGSLALVNGCKKDADTTAPVITLTGANPYVISSIGTSFVEPGYSATDDNDGNVTSTVVVDASAFNKDSAGTYEIHYTATDKAGNTSEQTREVVVNNTLETTGYKGSYSVQDVTPGQSPTNYSDVITYSNIVNGRIWIAKFGDYQNGKVYADISGGTVTVPVQNVVCGTTPAPSRQFSGSGTINTAGGTTTMVINFTEVTNGTTTNSVDTYTK